MGQLRWNQIGATLIVNLLSVHLGVISGWMMGKYPAIALEKTSYKIHMYSSTILSILGRLPFLCILVLLPLAAYISEKYGRKVALAASAVPFILASILMAFTKNSVWLTIAVNFSAITCAMHMYLVPIYVSEISSSDGRGLHGVVLPLLMGFGMNLDFLIEQYFGKLCAIVGFILSLVFLTGLTILPESPLWIARKERTSGADRALAGVRIDDAATTEPEAANLNEESANVPNTNDQPKGLKKFFKFAGGRTTFGVAFTLIIAQAIFQIYLPIGEHYAHNMRWRTENIKTMSLIPNMGVSLVTLLLINCVGGRKMLITSTTGMVVIFCALSAILAVNRISYDTNAYNDMIVFILGIEIFYTLGVGTAPSVIVPEIIPNNAVSYIYALLMGIFWTIMWITAEFDWMVMNKDDVHGWCLNFEAFCMFLVVFICTFVPETKGEFVDSCEKI